MKSAGVVWINVSDEVIPQESINLSLTFESKE